MFGIHSALLVALWNEYARTLVQAGIFQPRAAYTISGEESQDLTTMSVLQRHQKSALHAYAWSKLNHHHHHQYLCGHSSPDLSCMGTHEYMQSMSRFLPISGTLVDRGFVVPPQSASANEGHAAIKISSCSFHAPHRMIEELRSVDPLGATRRLRYRIATFRRASARTYITNGPVR